MEFDRAAYEDEYMKIEQISLEEPSDSMKNLYASARNYRAEAKGIYVVLAQTIYVKFPPLFRDMQLYSDLAEFDELNRRIESGGTDEEMTEYKDALKDIIYLFVKEGRKFNVELASLIKLMKSSYKELENNIRPDLSSGAFFYGKIEIALKERGKQLEELSTIIKDVYISRMNTLKAKVKAYDEQIDTFIDPGKSFENFMKALPTADEFGSLTKFTEKKPDAQVEAMKAAYSVAIKGATYIGTRMVNVTNMEIRDQLQDELRKLQEEYDKYKSQYDRIIGEYELVKNLVVILDGMKFFANEANKFVKEFSPVYEKLESDVKEKNISAYNAELKNLQETLSVFWND